MATAGVEVTIEVVGEGHSILEVVAFGHLFSARIRPYPGTTGLAAAWGCIGRDIARWLQSEHEEAPV